MSYKKDIIVKVQNLLETSSFLVILYEDEVCIISII